MGVEKQFTTRCKCSILLKIMEASDLFNFRDVTPMILKADLQCPCCYKKIKKTLCKFPQIRDQVYNEKTNTVAITVVCCSPERIRDKLCSKGGRAIKSIEIIDKKEPEKPKEADKPKLPAEKPKEKPKEAEKPKEKPKEAEKPKEKPKEAEKPKADGPPPANKPKADGPPPADKPKAEGPPPANKPKADGPPPEPPAAAKPPQPAPANGVPSVFPYMGPSYDAYNAGPYYHGYGVPPPPPQPCYRYEGHYGHGYGPYGHGHGHCYGGVAHVNKCDSYFTEENPQACTIM